MMKRQLHRMRQLAQTGSLGRTPETAEFLGEDLLQVEQRLEPAKRAAHNVHKRLQACLQGQSGADMDKRVKKLPLMALSTTMAESFKELDPDSSMGKALEMSCAIQNQLARILAEFEMTLERDVLQPLSRLSEEELPAILKHKKSLQKLVSDWNTLKSRLSQATKNSGSSQGLGGGPGSHSHTTMANKVETLKEEEEELKRKVEQCRDEYLADLYHFVTKEDSYANYFIHLLEIQADYHRRSLSSLDTALAELRENHGQADHSPSMTATHFPRVYGVSLATHLQELGREIALPIEACVMMLLSEGMKEEGLFRLAAGASVLKRLKQTMASDPHSLEEFCSDPHAVAGALKSYLRELPEPLMTFDLYDDWMRAASLKEPGARLQALQEVCSHLPPENLSNLRYLMKFLARLAEEQEVNKMTPSNIAIVLGPNLLWPPEKEGDQAQLDAASVSSIQTSTSTCQASSQLLPSRTQSVTGWPLRNFRPLPCPPQPPPRLRLRLQLRLQLQLQLQPQPWLQWLPRKGQSLRCPPDQPPPRSPGVPRRQLPQWRTWLGGPSARRQPGPPCRPPRSPAPAPPLQPRPCPLALEALGPPKPCPDVWLAAASEHPQCHPRYPPHPLSLPGAKAGVHQPPPARPPQVQPPPAQSL
ncbi:SH3 domain-binding protein 1 isoform X2 [Gorilla gorilla gorilla]|uniref:SH3 domain-binding protein 1 isoform X2 n=1 Tax=Gorilla gorilla gorilla TaxID=9595 RepID=UPI002445E29B|nr:SH3 domain-binding protein 1 isoform X3 [Gorilla gorilla gorilla]